jgi:hypothetical protein
MTFCNEDMSDIELAQSHTQLLAYAILISASVGLPAAQIMISVLVITGLHVG